MDVYVHEQTGSVCRMDDRWRGSKYVRREFPKDYSEQMKLGFYRFEDHRASTTAWFVDLKSETGRQIPMRISEFERLLKKGHDMLLLEGTFGISKRGSSVGFVMLDE